MLLMLHYDVWQSSGGFESLEKSIKGLRKINFIREIIEVLEILIDKIGFKEIDIDFISNH
jgi:hypothetical protein